MVSERLRQLRFQVEEPVRANFMPDAHDLEAIEQTARTLAQKLQ